MANTIPLEGELAVDGPGALGFPWRWLPVGLLVGLLVLLGWGLRRWSSSIFGLAGALPAGKRRLIWKPPGVNTKTRTWFLWGSITWMPSPTP